MFESYPSFSEGLAQYYQRAAIAVTTEEYTSVILILVSQIGNIVEHKRFDTEYVAPTEG